MGMGVAFRAFFSALFDSEKSAAIQNVLDGEVAPPGLPEPSREPEPEPEPETRSEAITLLAALQREARLLDLVMESLDGFEDAQIGAASRDVLQKSRQVLDRMFGVGALRNESEGASVDVPVDFDPNLIHLVGNVSGEPPYTGKLAHAGWEATRCEIPQWSGSDASRLTIAAAEVEL